MGHIFISYSHKDSSYVHRLAEALKQEGFEVWIDDNIHYGSEWPRVVTRNLDASDGVIVVLSNNSLESDMVQNEVTRAREEKKPIFPLLLEGKNWLIVQAKQFVDVRDGSLPTEKFYKRLEEITQRENKKAERKVAKKIDREKIEEAAKQKSQLEVAERQAVRKAAIAKLIAKAVPFFRIIVVIGIFISLFWVGSLIVPKFIALVPMPQAAATTTQRPVVKATSTNAPVSPTLTLKPNPTPTKTLTPAPTSLPTEITDAKGVQMVLVQAGKFTMGLDSIDDITADEGPSHIVSLDAFYIDKFEVTNALYKVCVDLDICEQPRSTTFNNLFSYYGNSEFDNYPVIYVDWNMAKAYCEWRDVYLPTEAQWEKAARGTDGRTYPWGEENVSCSRANYRCEGKTVRIGSYADGKSVYGAYDMIGNVWEWVSDWYDENYYKKIGEDAINPQGPSSGQYRILRGSPWYFYTSNARITDRFKFDPTYSDVGVGFRCARDTNP